MSRPWLVLASGCVLVGVAAGIGFVAAADWYPYHADAVARGGGGVVGAVLGLAVAAAARYLADTADRVDSFGHGDEILDLDDILAMTAIRCTGPVGTGLTDIADTVGVTGDVS